MKRFRESCFGHLLGLHKIAFSGQIVHALALRRVEGLGVKGMLGLSYAIESNVAQFSLRNEVVVLHREKGELEDRVLRLEKCTSHADARKTEDAGEESHKIDDAEEESDKIEDGGVAESREQCVQNAKEEVQYTPPNINWDDPNVVCVTLVKFLTNPPRKIDMSTAEGECGHMRDMP
ncbi:unnamed protein product [Prunus brigantina]